MSGSIIGAVGIPERERERWGEVTLDAKNLARDAAGGTVGAVGIQSVSSNIWGAGEKGRGNVRCYNHHWYNNGEGTAAVLAPLHRYRTYVALHRG